MPSVVLYADRQLQDIRGFCCSGNDSSVLGFDKTYNLGSIYVTPSVDKNLALQRHTMSDFPIFMGPIFIHGHSDFDSYAYVFGSLSAQLVDVNRNQMVFGLDDEQAMRKAMEHCFPMSSFVVCTRHLQENVHRKVDSLIGTRAPHRRSLLDGLVDDAGLSACTDAVSFEEAVTQYRNNILPSGPPDFANYVERRVFHLLRQNVKAGRSKWTNNNCEAINHVLKQSIQWRPQQLPQHQYREADRALL